MSIRFTFKSFANLGQRQYYHMIFASTYDESRYIFHRGEELLLLRRIYTHINIMRAHAHSFYYNPRSQLVENIYFFERSAIDPLKSKVIPIHILNKLNEIYENYYNCIYKFIEVPNKV